MKSSHCDCGNVATIFDSTGPHCADCDSFVRRITTLITNLILAQRAEKNFDPIRAKNTARYNRWKAKNREKFLAYQRNYHRAA